MHTPWPKRIWPSNGGGLFFRPDGHKRCLCVSIFAGVSSAGASEANEKHPPLRVIDARKKQFFAMYFSSSPFEGVLNQNSQLFEYFEFF